MSNQNAFFSTDPQSFCTQYPGHMIFGAGSVRRIAGLLVESGALSVMLITDAGIRSAGLLQPLLGDLQIHGMKVSVFDGVEHDPTMAGVDALLAHWQRQPADAVLAIGGGSVVDAAKMFIARLCSNAPVEHLLAVGDPLITKTPPTFVAVPTTTPNGSESSAAVLIRRPDGSKIVFRSYRHRPQWIVLDPELTRTAPPEIAAATGFDVVMHALGAATNNAINPIGEALAQKAFARAIEWLPRVHAKPESLEARSEVMMAGYLAGVAIALKGVDGIHGLCTPLESLANAPHGNVLAVVCEPVMRFNIHMAAPRYAELSRACGWARKGRSVDDAANEVYRRVIEIRDLFGLPSSLSELGVSPQALGPLADMAFTNSSTRLNPRALSRSDIVALYEAMTPQVSA